MPKLQLRGRLIISYLLIILIVAGTLLLYIWFVPVQTISNSSQFFNRRQAANFAPVMVELYAQTNSWAHAEAYTQRLTTPHQLDNMSIVGPISQIDFDNMFTIQRAILTDSQYVVLSDSSHEFIAGTPLPTELQSVSVPLELDGQLIGHLALFNPLGQNLLDIVRPTARRIVTSVTLWSAVIALVVSLVLAQQLSRPLRTLDTAVRTLAAGQSPTPIPVTSQDEIGSLTTTFNEMAQALRQQKELRQQLIADIAHELRTPLAVMQLEVEAIEDGLQSAEQAIPTLSRKINTLERLIADLRLLSLADAKELELRLAPLNPTTFLTELVQSWQTQATAAAVTLTLNLPTTLPTILADEQRFYQIFHNLISNALHYTPQNGRIEVGGRDDGHALTLWVSDSGAGIPADQLPHIFSRFYRADKSRSRETGGSGLGLAITQRLVTLHNGRITADSTPNQGTTFTLTFPTNDYRNVEPILAML